MTYRPKHTAVEADDLLAAYLEALDRAVRTVLGKPKLCAQLPSLPVDPREQRRLVRRYGWALMTSQLTQLPVDTHRRVVFAAGVEEAIERHVARKRIRKFLAMVQDGDERVNLKSHGFLPRHAGEPFARSCNRLKLDGASLPAVRRDYMLDEWGIHHVHCDVNHGPGLLFVAFHDGAAFVLGLEDTHDAADGVRHFHQPGLLRRWLGEFPFLFCPPLQAVHPSDTTSAGLQGLRANNAVPLVPVERGLALPFASPAGSGQPAILLELEHHLLHVFRQLAERLASGAHLAEQVYEVVGDEVCKLDYAIEVRYGFPPRPTHLHIASDHASAAVLLDVPFERFGLFRGRRKRTGDGGLAKP